MPSKRKKPAKRGAPATAYHKISHAKLVSSGKAPANSRVSFPVQIAWQVFSDTREKYGKAFTRKIAIDAALYAGVAYYTARTQYQEWKAAGDRDRIAAQKIMDAKNNEKANWLIIVYDDVGHVKQRHSAANLTKEQADALAQDMRVKVGGESAIAQKNSSSR